jgi:hypothetical protein
MRNKKRVRLLAYATGSVNQELLLQNEHLPTNAVAAQNTGPMITQFLIGDAYTIDGWATAMQAAGAAGSACHTVVQDISPNPECLQHPDADHDDHDRVENCPDASRHGDVSIDEPKGHADNHEHQDDVYERHDSILPSNKEAIGVPGGFNSFGHSYLIQATRTKLRTKWSPRCKFYQARLAVSPIQPVVDAVFSCEPIFFFS